MADNKVMIFGIDGATFDIILPMIERGELPTFKSFIEEGASGYLKSTHPPHTVPSWPTCFTGVNPGKHSLFDFRKDSHLNYDDGKVFLSTDIKAKTIWDLLSEREREVMVVAMPLTNPPSAVKGVMVSPTRVIEHDNLRTYPQELSNELSNVSDIVFAIKKRKDFMEMHTSKVQSRLETFFDTTVVASRKIIEELTKIDIYLMDNYKCDFGMFMLPIDALQHALWCFMDEKHPAHNSKLTEKYKGSIFEGYKWVDSALEKILRKLDKDTTIILVSDHGFGPLHKIFYLNRWLIENGLLKLNESGNSSIEIIRMPICQILERLRCGFLSSVLPNRLKNARIPFLRKRTKPLTEVIDWQNTKAYATSYALNINLKNREPNGIVKPGTEYKDIVMFIKEELLKLKDPETGKQVIEKVAEKNELYSGPYLEDASDLFPFFKDPKYSIGKDPFSKNLFRKLMTNERLSGHHTSFPNGICIMKGPKISNVKLKDANILDIMPTALYLMGEPVPENLDGRVLTEAICQEYLESHPVATSKCTESDITNNSIKKEELTAEEEEAIKKRLGELGYLG